MKQTATLPFSPVARLLVVVERGTRKQDPSQPTAVLVCLENSYGSFGSELVRQLGTNLYEESHAQRTCKKCELLPITAFVVVEELSHDKIQLIVTSPFLPSVIMSSRRNSKIKIDKPVFVFDDWRLDAWMT